MKYYLYDKYGICNEYTCKDNFFGEGSNGSIYKIDDATLLKIFKFGNHSERLLNMVSDMNLDNFYKIYTLLYNQNGDFVGYLMKLYEEEYIDILTMPCEYTIDNLIRLKNSIKRLTDNNIRIYDMREGNTILDNSNITIIDIDLYRIVDDYNHAYLKNENYNSLINLFREIFYKSLCIYHYGIRSDRLIIDSLFSKDNNIEDISKKLVKHKYPIDYLNDKRKRYYGYKAI